jgi:8-oxo-dGTP pyrophosphatase MutT (NUDIX family)
MYSIYINDRLLRLVSGHESVPASEMLFKLSGQESPEYLKALVAAFETNTMVETMTLQSNDLDITWRTFSGNYQVLEAAGGVVVNSKMEALMIFRNGKWDLPKGKIESGEEPDTAAIREVYEECGIGMLSLHKQLPTTLHTYPWHDTMVLKKTYWFQMTTVDESVPKPQLEEGITKVCWMSRKELRGVMDQTYASIRLLLQENILLPQQGMLG